MPVHLGNVVYSTEHTEVWRLPQMEIRKTSIKSYEIDKIMSTATIWDIDAHSQHIRLYGGELITLRNMLAQILGDDDDE